MLFFDDGLFVGGAGKGDTEAVDAGGAAAHVNLQGVEGAEDLFLIINN